MEGDKVVIGGPVIPPTGENLDFLHCLYESFRISPMIDSVYHVKVLLYHHFAK